MRVVDRLGLTLRPLLAPITTYEAILITFIYGGMNEIWILYALYFEGEDELCAPKPKAEV